VESNINGDRVCAGISADALRARFAETTLSEDPLDVAMPPGLHRWPHAMRERLDAPLKPAAVLVPIMERADGMTVLLTQRSADLRIHAGQASFPGGRMEPHDPDVCATALRETHEEVGITPDSIDIIGYLQPMPTITGFAVTPVVGLVRDPVDLIIDRTEVEYTFEIPLDFLLDEANDRLVEREWEGKRFRLREFHFDDERVWGATAYMILAFRNFVLNK
jgi:8-oxo-dGTP pyrophosphatase MutT (NUDIX family)